MIINKKKLFIYILFILIILFFIIVLYIPNTLNKKFDSDEFQHVHIAWLLKEGNILYKDVFDHHGPVYVYIISTIWKIFNFNDQSNTLIKLRIISLILLIILLIITYLITKKIFNTLTGLLTLIIILSNKIIYVKGIELRPDLIQNIFLFLGFYFLISIIIDNKKRYDYYYLVGIFWGLTIIANFKTAIIIGGCSLLYLIIYYKNIKLIYLVKIIFGLLLVVIPILLYFYSKNTLDEFFYYNYTYNFKAYFIQKVSIMKTFDIKNNGEYYIALFALFLLGAYFLFRRNLDKKFNFFLIIFSIFLIILTNLNFYSQWTLALYPIISIIPGYGLYLIFKFRIKSYNHIISAIAISFFIFHIFYNDVYTIFNKEYNNKTQIEFTNYINSISDKDDIIFTIWNNHGGYMFRNHLLYYWFINENQEKIMNNLLGYELLGKNLINQLENNKIKFIIMGEIDGLLLKKEYNDSYLYIVKNYFSIEKYPYLWIRKL